MILTNKNRNRSAANGKHRRLYSAIAKVAALSFLIIYASHLSNMEAFCSVVSYPAERHLIQEDTSLLKPSTPTPSEFAVKYFHQGLKYYNLGRWQEAIMAFREATAIKPDYAVAYFGLGTAYSRLEIWDRAVTSFKKAVEIDPDYAEGYLGLGIAYGILGFNSEAIAALRMATQIKPGYGQAHYALALGYLLLSDKASALKEYGILKTLDPNLADQLIRLIKDNIKAQEVP